MAQLSKEELDQIKKLEQKLTRIQNKFGSLKNKQEFRLKLIKDSYEKKIKELNKKIIDIKKYLTGSTEKSINARIAEYEKEMLEAKNAHDKAAGKINGGFHRAKQNLGRMQQRTLDKINKLKNPNLLNKAKEEFKKIPNKKIKAGIAIGTGAALAAATLARYKHLEKQRKERLNQD